jgi:hypothetical protein
MLPSSANTRVNPPAPSDAVTASEIEDCGWSSKRVLAAT